MLPYTTPYHIFKLPIEFQYILKLFITYSQEGTTLFEKSIEDCEPIEEGTKVRVLLAQEETGKIVGCECKVEVQMTLLTADNKRLTSNIVKLSSGRALKKEVI